MKNLLILVVFLLWLVKKCGERWAHFQKLSNINLPGPKPSFWFGNLLEFEGRRSGKCAVDLLDEWHGEYGDLYGFYNGVRPTVVIHNLDLIKEILVTRSYQHFSSRLTPVVHTKPLLDTLVGRKGQSWKDLRSNLSPMFSPCKIRHMTHHMTESIRTTVRILSGKVGKNVDVLPMFQALSCEVIGKCCLGMAGVSCQTNPRDILLNAMRDFLGSAVNTYILLARCFPWFATVIQFYLNLFSKSGHMTRIVCDHVARAIHIRRGEKATGDLCHPPRVDILQFLLESLEKRDMSSKPGMKNSRKLTDDEIIANSWMFLLGGFETTSVALTFVSHLLAHNPHIQDKLYHHILSNISTSLEKENPGLNYEHVAKMDYLDQVLSESLRLYPPVVTFVIREGENEMRIGDFLLPAGITIMVPVWQIHHNHKLWPDPYKFDPDRFNRIQREKHHPMSFVPFGAGPRNCIGMRFALLEMKLALAQILLKFRILPVHPMTKHLKIIVPTVNISPKDSIYLKFVPRS